MIHRSILRVVDHPGIVKRLEGIAEKSAERHTANPLVRGGFFVNIEVRVGNFHKMAQAGGAMGVRRDISRQ